MELDSTKLVVAKEYLNYQKEFNNAKDDLKLGWTITGVISLFIPFMVFIFTLNPISFFSCVFGLPFAILPMFEKEELKGIKQKIIKDNMTTKEFDSFLKSKEIDKYLEKIKENDENLNSMTNEVSSNDYLKQENKSIYKPVGIQEDFSIKQKSEINKKR